MTIPKKRDHTPPETAGAGLFIVGMPRSGTTLLANLLEQRTLYVGLPESHFFSRFVWESILNRTTDGLSAAWRRFADSRPWPLVSDQKNSSSAHDDSPDSPGRYRRVFLDWVEAELAAAGKSPKTHGWIENSPPHTEGLPFIRRLFPEHRVVGMIRDPRAVHASLRDVRWNSSHAAANAARWRWYANYLAKLAKTAPEHIRIVHFESLVTDTEETLSQLARWLNIALESPSDTPASTTRSFHPEAEPWKRLALEPPDSSRIDAWRTKLEAEEIAAIERWAWPDAAGHGYKRTLNDPGHATFHEYRAVLAMHARLAAYRSATELRVALWR